MRFTLNTLDEDEILNFAVTMPGNMPLYHLLVILLPSIMGLLGIFKRLQKLKKKNRKD